MENKSILILYTILIRDINVNAFYEACILRCTDWLRINGFVSTEMILYFCRELPD